MSAVSPMVLVLLHLALVVAVAMMGIALGHGGEGIALPRRTRRSRRSRRPNRSRDLR